MPSALEHLIQRCVAKDPDDRWQTARDLHQQLKWITGMPAPAPVAQGRQPWPWVAATSALAIASVAIVLWILNRQAEAPNAPAVTRLLIPVPQFGSLAPTFGSEITISRDGSRVAYLALDRETKLLGVYIRNLNELDARMIPGSTLAAASTQAGTGATPFFSPDGGSIGFRTRDGIMRASLAGGPPVKILDDPAAFLGAEWQADNTVIYTVGRVLYRVSAGGGGVGEQLTPDWERGTQFIIWPRLLPTPVWSPNSNTLAFTAGGPGDFSVVQLPTDGTAREPQKGR